MKGKEQKKEQKKEKATGGKAKVPSEYQRNKLSKQNKDPDVK
jgi:hypothetical protein